MSKDKCGYNLDDLLEDACESFDKDYGDMRMANNSVPIYYWDIAQYAAHNPWLMTEIPDIMSDGNAHDQIKSNIYTYIYDELTTYKEKKENEDESN
jgi:hypothetical protein